MKIFYGLLLLILPLCLVNAQNISATFSPLPDASITNAIKRAAMNESVSVKRDDKKTVATAYFNIPDCGAYSALAEIKRDTVFIMVNNANRCDGAYKYHKLEAIIDNPENREYTVWIDPAFTFLEKGETLRKFRDTYEISDIDGDKKPNAAIAEYEKVVTANDSVTNDCGRTDCTVTVKFGKGVPNITIGRCYNLGIEPLPDLNNDGRDEIIMAVYDWTGTRYDVLVYSYNGKKWSLLCEAKVYDEVENDASRVVKEKDGYYLNYEGWDDTIFDVVAAKKKIKTR
ncbi:hypothetical protein HYN59_07630 [Flavobacterium album]|uniref:VCBS repeat-containing protein n=1 Tax=Flavobacterium album TaxID=2175091 RepID=A0A2S1QX85_9FLAO|nr:hypothetical protein [Flavobacterium album]AWH85003.1 hypothetical protein HYN59_07630 [Flavobacterium album]